MKHPYPIMVNLSGRTCLVVGGGLVAQRKVQSLLQAGAAVTVISLSFTEALMDLGSRSEVVLSRQNFDPAMLNSSLKGSCYTLVVAATNDAQVNAQIEALASREGILVNVVDQPQLSSFIVPSVVRRGKLVIAVSTGGASPSTARKIVQELDERYGEEYELYLEFLSELRLFIQKKVMDKQERQRMFKEMLAWDVLAHIREGTFERWKEKLYDALEKETRLNEQTGEVEISPSAWSAIRDFE
ncbi:bifunctional precorrin-2 dehydrogenase/sirohydrochlorin ferrochelatase [Paenibacillus sp. HWE-109]|uniref:precorrin-2 dehydrogenase/sirohydrochlorin ferrochelatase family protein n=1 Tax=Paenibacillus sp. HWE-109 TaxID=1306526 RepID=UPI001EDF0B57|nr:bifunctional precorrin-2 dehydrogenase/sirohydrochlorin ferrochelatase [Paenibacillus sp. HWE-109]UKS27703.1 bifunctional precorrin-2 dehydrogenase/sirohydrochlorin ferrochelatase [Paenibacillus sp. HWE-109]